MAPQVGFSAHRSGQHAAGVSVCIPGRHTCAIGGIAIGVAIGIIYWLGAELLAAMGAIGQLPPLLAGWSPDIVFFFLGLYFFFKMPDLR